MRKAASVAVVCVSWAALVFTWALELGWVPLQRVGVIAGFEGAFGGPGLLAVAAVGAYALVLAPFLCAVIAWRLRGERGRGERALFWAAALYCLAVLITLAPALRAANRAGPVLL